MERTTSEMARLGVDDGHMPGGDRTAELADELTDLDDELAAGSEPRAVGDRLDASIFDALLHP